MTKITQEEILKLASLARLHLSDKEVSKFQEEINDIIGYAGMLSDVDTDDLRPTYQVTGLDNVRRDDVVVDYGATPEELLGNAPETKGKYIKVRRMIG